MVDSNYCLHGLHEDEVSTLESMGTVLVMPTHCLNVQKQMSGFRQEVDNNDLASSLCVNRSMFFGHSLFEVKCGDDLVNEHVVRLLGQDNTGVMKELMDSFEGGRYPMFHCIPDNADAVMDSKISYARGKRSVDSRPWDPDAPQSVGLYHAMVRGYQKDLRLHKLFIAVSGGCSKCSDAFYNLMLDVGSEWTAREVAESEEVWWLRKACQRARCKVASRAAAYFGLRVEEHCDVHGYDQDLVAVPATDTVEHDLAAVDSKVYLYNGCCNTASQTNGVLCQMSPSEGYWLFKGNQRSSSRSTSLGSMAGHLSGVFTTHSPLYHAGFGSPQSLQSVDTRVVVRVGEKRTNRTNTQYQCFDEAYMRQLEGMGWNRDFGVVEMVPIVVGCL